MIFLILSILFSSVTVSFFKVFEIKKVDTFQAIIANYLTCSLVGSLFMQQSFFGFTLWKTDWLATAAVLGFLFIGIFYCIALTAQRISVSASMVAAKLSVVIPVIIARIWYGEDLNAFKIAGISISLLAVFFISKKSGKQDNKAGKILWLLPVLVFTGSGCIDSLIHYLEDAFIPPYTADDILTTAFFFACITGILILLPGMVNGKTSLSWHSLKWGILLGIPNYFSMYFLVKTLGDFPATFIFPINNIGIVALSTLMAFFLFQEKPNRYNLLGLGMAVLAILLISLS